ncbi:transcriptional repressor [uncultured Dokdonia sp.]|uniref:Fur family transcriptional regulator n=1 Tax=uncultured Dokdonia sp. TaxID=575653 RepID=UPI00260FB4D6|nr:transcriptional repressor [uncultured Dokdonia sp.]
MGIVRKTKSVEALLNEFQNNSGAISAIELIKRFNSQFNKTTVYRVLDKLEDDGILHSFLDIKGIKWYAKCNGCSANGHLDTHPHFQCMDCGNVDCLPVEVHIPKISNREVFSSQILLQGICNRCIGSS